MLYTYIRFIVEQLLKKFNLLIIDVSSTRVRSAEKNLEDNIVIMISFQVPIAMLTVILNLYCLLTMLYSKKLRSLEYVLVLFQSLYDLLFTGVAGFLYYLRTIITNASFMCLVITVKDDLVKKQ